MKTLAVTFFTCTCALFLSLQAQTYLDLTDNLVLESNSWVIINPNLYEVQDIGNDGVIQITNKEKIIIEGPDVYADGTNYQGYLFKIDNSDSIVIRGFGSGEHYKYAVYATNSEDIIVENNNFSFNKVDSSGWINVWAGYQQALGGGVMFYNTHSSRVSNNMMNMQNDGVALYNCSNIQVANNNFAWNTSYGIRMYFTDNCTIHNNLAPHINRPFTNPSDCAAILLIVSNENTVTYNDFSYSGDGIFLGQYEYSNIPNNNYFAYNECSYSPHNAIEATFADGNIYKHNICNYSHYGLWLGYSFNSLVDSNQVIGNQHSGIAIDRGYNNTIINNIIQENPVGVELWKGANISGYENQFSHDYYILHNVIESNRVGVSSINTPHLIMQSNDIRYNRNAVLIDEDSPGDSIRYNTFRNSVMYHIENQSVFDVQADNNFFIYDDPAFIQGEIFDKQDNQALGNVFLDPVIPGNTSIYQHLSPPDLAEPGFSYWTEYPEICPAYGHSDPTFVEWDTEQKVAGDASVHLSTGNGWDIGVCFHPAGDTIASWFLSESDSLTLWLRSENNTGYGFQFCNLLIGNNSGGYYKYTTSAPAILNPTIGNWKEYKVPLAGGSPWYRTTFGNISFEEISYIEFHADTWDFGFELWIDGVSFGKMYTGEKQKMKVDNGFMVFYTADKHLNIEFTGTGQDDIFAEILAMSGEILTSFALPNSLEKMTQSVYIPSLARGVYLVKLTDGEHVFCRKFMVRE